MFSLNSKRLFKLAYIATENKKSTFQFAKKNWLETANREHQLKTALSRFCLNGHAKEIRNTLIDFRINHKSEWGLRQLASFTTVYFVGIIFFLQIWYQREITRLIASCLRQKRRSSIDCLIKGDVFLSN